MPSTARGVGQRSRRRGLGIAGECVGSSAGRPDGVGSPPPPPPPPGRVSSSRFSPLRAPSGDREWVVRIVLGLGTSAVVVPGRSSTLSASASISSTNKSNTFCTAASSASHPSASSSFCSFAPLSVPVRAVAWSVLVVVPRRAAPGEAEPTFSLVGRSHISGCHAHPSTIIPCLMQSLTDSLNAAVEDVGDVLE